MNEPEVEGVLVQYLRTEAPLAGLAGGERAQPEGRGAMLRKASTLNGFTMRREQVQNSPEYDPARPVERTYESRLYDYYGRPRYWARDRAA
jgi:hypothetical protein